MGSQSCLGRHVGGASHTCVSPGMNERHELLSSVSARGRKGRNVGEWLTSARPEKSDAFDSVCGIEGKDSGVAADFSTAGLEASIRNRWPSGREGFYRGDGRQTADHRAWRDEFQEVCLGPSSKICHDKQTIRGSNMAATSNSNGANVERQRSPMEFTVRTLALATSFGGICGLIRVLLSALPPDFANRWRSLFNAPEAEVPRTGGSELPTVFYDRNGVVIATIASEGYGYQRDEGGSGKPKGVTAGDIPSWMWQAVVASEDRRFFQHQGIDARGLSRAVLSLASSGGGSTITQQVCGPDLQTSKLSSNASLGEAFLHKIEYRWSFCGSLSVMGLSSKGTALGGKSKQLMPPF